MTGNDFGKQAWKDYINTITITAEDNLTCCECGEPIQGARLCGEWQARRLGWHSFCSAPKCAFDARWAEYFNRREGCRCGVGR